MPQAGKEQGGFSRAAVHVPRSPVRTSCTSLSLLAPGAGGDHSHFSGGTSALSCSPSGLGPRGCPSPHHTCCSVPTHARSAHCWVQLSRCCSRLLLRADTGSKPGQEEEQRVVSAHCDASLRLRRCHSTARTSVSPELLPRQGKLCKELRSFISSFSLCCHAPSVPAQQRQRKPRQTAKVRRDLPWIACEASDCLRTKGLLREEASLRPNCKQQRPPAPATNRQAISAYWKQL